MVTMSQVLPGITIEYTAPGQAAKTLEILNVGLNCVFVRTSEGDITLSIAEMAKKLTQCDCRLVLIDGQTYDLGACLGTYDASCGVFDVGNAFVPVWDTIYATK